MVSGLSLELPLLCK